MKHLKGNESYLTRLVSGVLLQDSKVLLGLRKNTVDFQSFWSLPVGHVEKCESDETAIQREMFEELGIYLKDVSPFCIKIDQAESIYHQVYIIDSWSGKIENREPDKCDQLNWFALDQLPAQTTPISRQIIEEILNE